MSALDVRPERLWRRAGEEVAILVDSDRAVEGTVVVTRLGDEVLRRWLALVGGRIRRSGSSHGPSRAPACPATPKAPPGLTSGVSVRARVVSGSVRVRFGQPAGGPALHDLAAADPGEYVQVKVPSFDTWSIFVVDR